MANNAPTQDYYKQLKDSVTFNMSLSSKELFHSNFLAWLADIDPAKFLEVLRSLGVNIDGLVADHYYPRYLENISQENSLVQPETQENELQPNYWIVRREYKNFDICVIDQLNPNYNYVNPVDLNEGDFIGGRIRVLIENKVKSIPYEDQLSSYTKKVKEYNSKWFKKTCKKRCQGIKSSNKDKGDIDSKICEASIENASFLLLSLAESFPQKETIKEHNPNWIIKSYAEYHDALNCFQNQSDGKIKDIVTDYLNFISALRELSQRWVNEDIFLYFKIDNKTREYSEEYKKCKSLRIHDLYHKLRFSKICSLLINKLKEDIVLKEYNANVTTSRIDRFIDSKNQESNNSQTKTVYAGIEFLHGEPLIELHVFIPGNSFLYVVQVQGSWYQHGIISKEKSSDVWSKLLPEKRDIFKKNNWMNIQQSVISDNKKAQAEGRDKCNDHSVMEEVNERRLGTDLLPLPDKIIKRNGNQYSGYHKYDMKDGSYVYQAREILTGIKISDIIALMVEDCRSLLSQNP